MADDIFDQAAAPPATGDVFDQAADPKFKPGSYQARKGGPVLNANEPAYSELLHSTERGLGMNPSEIAEAPSALSAVGTGFKQMAGSALDTLGRETGKYFDKYPPLSRPEMIPLYPFHMAARGAEGLASSAEASASDIEAGIRNRDPRSAAAGVGGALGGRAQMEMAERGGEALQPTAKLLGTTARAGYRAAGNPFGLASTGEELLTQGISPRASATTFKASLAKAAPDLKAYHAESPIKNVQDLNDAIPEIKEKIWASEVDPALKRQAAKPVNMAPVADAVRKQITPEMREFDSANADKLDTLAAKLGNTRDVGSANSLLKYVNGQLESYFSKYPAARRANLMANPETAGWEAARSELRNQFLSTLEQAGETGVREARLRYGSLTDIGDEVERLVNVADRAKPMSLGRILGLVGAVPTGGLSVAAGELSTYLNKPDVLVRRGIKRLGRSAPSQPPALLGRKTLFPARETEGSQ
jgi:hypothetical protein